MTFDPKDYSYETGGGEVPKDELTVQPDNPVVKKGGRPKGVKNAPAIRELREPPIDTKSLSRQSRSDQLSGRASTVRPLMPAPQQIKPRWWSHSLSAQRRSGSPIGAIRISGASSRMPCSAAISRPACTYVITVACGQRAQWHLQCQHRQHRVDARGDPARRDSGDRAAASSRHHRRARAPRRDPPHGTGLSGRPAAQHSTDHPHPAART